MESVPASGALATSWARAGAPAASPVARMAARMVARAGLRIQLNMAEQNGPESTRYCGGCHDPISLFSGAKNLYTDPAKLTAVTGYHEGVCVDR